MGDADGELHHLQPALDIALGIGNGLAVLAGEAVGELVVVAVGELQEFHEHAGAPLRVGGRPGRLRGLGVLDRRRHLGRGGQRHPGAEAAVHRLEHVAEPSRRASYMPAADEMRKLCRHGASPIVPLEGIGPS
jgi:hypothetical protein